MGSNGRKLSLLVMPKIAAGGSGRCMDVRPGCRIAMCQVK